ncbi:hypothetical protein ACVBEF_05805 [Glaciimonas sp. GG7]
MNLFLLCINTFVSVAVLVHAMCTLNKMTKQTNYFYWIGYLILAAGSFYVALGPLYGHYKTQWSEVMFNTGAALVLIIGWWLREKQKANGGGEL